MRVEDWRTVGRVPGGKNHLIVRVQVRCSGDPNFENMVRARTDCGRMVWVELVPWTDIWYEEPDACRFCAPHVARMVDREDRLAAAEARAALPERVPLTDDERAERQDRLRDMRLMETLHFIAVAAGRQAAKPEVLESREALTALIDELNLSLRRSRKALRTYGETVDRQAIELNELRGQVARLTEVNKVLARESAKAELLREFMTTLYR
jgi:hypothetical protein